MARIEVDITAKWLVSWSFATSHCMLWHDYLTPGLDAAINEIANLNDYTTPYEKLQCVGRAFKLLTSGVSENGTPMTADEILPLITVLVIRCTISNWQANLTIMSELWLSGIRNDEVFPQPN